MGKPDDELSTVARTTNDCKSRKRKNNNNVKNNPKKIKVFSDDEIEHCYICGEDIPRSEFNQHVNDELERKRKEDEEKGKEEKERNIRSMRHYVWRFIYSP